MRPRRQSRTGKAGNATATDRDSPANARQYQHLLILLLVIGLLAVALFVTQSAMTGFSVLLNDTLNYTEAGNATEAVIPEPQQVQFPDMPDAVEPWTEGQAGIRADRVQYSQYEQALITGRWLEQNAIYELHITDSKGAPAAGYPLIITTGQTGTFTRAWNTGNTALDEYRITAAPLSGALTFYTTKLWVTSTAPAPPLNASPPEYQFNMTLDDTNLTENLTVDDNSSLYQNMTADENVTEETPGNTTQNLNFSDLPEILLKDSKRQDINHTQKITQDTERPGHFNVAIDVDLKSVRKINLNGVKSNETIAIGLEDLPATNTSWMQYYAIDLSNTNFTEGQVTAVAKGNTLYKCKDWNFTGQQCLGTWEKILDITPGKEYTFNVTPVDPGYAEKITYTYYMHNSTEPSFPTYYRLINQTPGVTQVMSPNLDLGIQGVQCWTGRWISKNWTEQALVNGTWNFTIYGGCDVTTAIANLFARIIKINSTGEYNFANTTSSIDNICSADPSISTFSYTLPYSSFTNLTPGERLGVSYCINVTTKKNNKIAHIYWQGSTPSNVAFPVSLYDDTPPGVYLGYFPDNKKSELRNITLTYTVYDVNPIQSCELLINGTINQTNNSVQRGIEQVFKLFDLQLVNYTWSINCTDILANEGASQTRSFQVINKTPPIVNITYPYNNSVFQQTQKIDFTASAFDNEDGNLSGTKVVWSSSKDGQLGWDTSLDIASLTPGNHTISFTATDSFGLSSTATINITIEEEGCIGSHSGVFNLSNDRR
ncbi:hypothetical protein KY363_07360 [Candidatus Woesearchaeota archaeon]|nr:hypothetical protein [Candidatus Woesearchaeota archaeon]